MKTRATLSALITVVLLGGCGRGPALDTRTFELQYLEPNLAAELVDPYVYGDRPDAPGRISLARNLITVRETEDNLEKIARVLARYDNPSPSVQLHFQIIEANGAGATDSAIADVESALRKLFRFRGYRLLAQAVLGGVEGSRVSQQIGQSESGLPLTINAGILAVRGTGDSGIVRLEVSLRDLARGSVFETTVNVRAGQTVVLGSTQPAPRGETLILTVRPEVLIP